ncbi:MAG TPA: NADPH-dependent F420 reductase [Acidimicrobiales bacterium]|nr:NADPH-dependent F420 reductase [Acidimicrobiales bacterium]
MSIGILGGTGPAGRALALRLASVGMEVRLGSRDAERAAATVAGLRERWPGRDLSLAGVANEEACGCDLVVLATPWDGAAPTAAALRDRLAGRVVVSMANAFSKVGDELQALVPPRGSVSVAVQQAAPEALVAGAFHHVPARGLGAIDEPLDADVLVCSDHERATAATIELVDAVPGLRGVDAGSLSAAAAIESFTAVLIGINLRQRAQASIRLTGLSG